MSRFPVLMMLLLALAGVATATDYRENHHGDGTAGYRDRGSSGAFSSAERNLIRSWLVEAERHDSAGQAMTGLPLGMQKKVAQGKTLPPGWQKKLVRGAHLDQVDYTHGRPLPAELLYRLPPPPPGSEILQIEAQIIRLDAATRVILDVFSLNGD